MATVIENRPAEYTIDEEQIRHNARIRERYDFLMNAEDNQLQDVYESGKLSDAVYAPERPATPAPMQEMNVMATPTAPTYSHTVADSRLFGPEMLDRRLLREEITMPLATKPEACVEMGEQSENIVQETLECKLSPFAKAVGAFFGVAVVAMLSLIALNTKVMQRKNIKMKKLEEKRSELRLQSSEIEARIQAAQSPESIAKWATEHGMVKE